MDLRRAIWGSLLAFLLIATVPASAAAGPALRFAERQLERTDRELAFREFPSHTLPSGRWQVTPARAWTSGFLPGAMWLAYRRTGDPVWRRRALRRQRGLWSQRTNTATHDVGFMLLPTYATGARLTGRRDLRRVALRGARSLASRFDPAVGATRSWGRRGSSPFRVIVDNLMNIELLFWGAKNGGPRAWRRMAHTHALTTLRDHVRPDGSTFHVVDYDTVTGQPVAKGTAQGLTAASTWSRGQAWAIHGFTTAYRETRDRRLLTAARRTADWWLARVPADHVPSWDFDARGPRDSSAAAIAASGLVELARLERSADRARRYRRLGVATLRSLASRRYLARGTRARSILRHGTAHYARGIADTGLAVGDYYFLEGLIRARLDL